MWQQNCPPPCSRTKLDKETGREEERDSAWDKCKLRCEDANIQSGDINCGEDL